MCAHALNLVGVKRVVYGIRNDKFGGHGSILSLHKFSDMETLQIDCEEVRKECVAMLQDFYLRGNEKLPEEKRHRK